MQQQHARILRATLLIFGVLLVALIFFALYWQQQQTSDIIFNYNGFRFQRDQAIGYKVQLYINNQAVPVSIHLREDPRTLENIPIIGDAQILRQKKQIYVTLDPFANLTGKTTIGALEIDAIIDNPYLFNIPVSSAFTKPYLNSTVKTCNDATVQEGIILLQTGETTHISVSDECIIIQGATEEDIIRASDRLVYTLLNIMES